MFKIQYKFKKGGPTYSCVYPSPEDTSNNIFLIKGRNDHGKSTIMQMVALGLYGTETGEIGDLLKEKILRLTSKDVDICEFDFSIVSKDGKIRIESSLGGKDGKPQVKVDGKLKAADYVKDNFQIIFDVPEETTKKIASALVSMRFKLNGYESDLQRYARGIRDCIERIEMFEDKEKSCKEREKKLKDIGINKTSYEKQLKEMKSEFIELEKAYIVNFFEDQHNKFNELERQVKEIDKRIKKLKSTGIGGGNKVYYESLQNFTSVLSDLKNFINSTDCVTKVINKSDVEALEAIRKGVNSTNTINDLTEERIKGWYYLFDKIIKQIDSDELTKKKMPEETQIELFSKLINILDDFISIDGAIPGTGGKNVIEFVNELNSSKKELENKISKKLELNNALSSCTGVTRSLSKVAEVWSQMPKKISSESADLEILKKQKSDKEDSMAKIAKELSILQDEYLSIPDNDRMRLCSYGTNIFQYYNESKNRIGVLEAKINNIDIEIKTTERILKEIKTSKKPDIKMSKAELDELHKITSGMVRKVNTWIEFIKSIDLEKMALKGEMDEESKSFYDAITDYFADILKTIYFENSGWKVKKVDFLKSIYLVEGREKPIGFHDPGTGHTALNSLLARLKQDYGGKKKILLFDEIGHMDNNNIKHLVDEIRKQVNNGEVILALLTQMDNSILDKVVVEPIK